MGLDDVASHIQQLGLQPNLLHCVKDRVGLDDVASHIQRIGCQPEKPFFTLGSGESRSWSAEQGKESGCTAYLD